MNYIYIPICFYYFTTFRAFNNVFVCIYIPICFYYFLNKLLYSLFSYLFTFQYVSIISIIFGHNINNSAWFTFQYVSIISNITGDTSCYAQLFTFQYVSIISNRRDIWKKIAVTHLHSNMFLLFRKHWRRASGQNQIYIPICFYYFLDEPDFGVTEYSFTFQYVSIISFLNCLIILCIIHLHSNMFLLFLSFQIFRANAVGYLHSNMFLLFLLPIWRRCYGNSNLHSNMFLLFPFESLSKPHLYKNLHSNMFLLFR